MIDITNKIEDVINYSNFEKVITKSNAYLIKIVSPCVVLFAILMILYWQFVHDASWGMYAQTAYALLSVFTSFFVFLLARNRYIKKKLAQNEPAINRNIFSPKSDNFNEIRNKVILENFKSSGVLSKNKHYLNIELLNEYATYYKQQAEKTSKNVLNSYWTIVFSSYIPLLVGLFITSFFKNISHLSGESKLKWVLVLVYVFMLAAIFSHLFIKIIKEFQTKKQRQLEYMHKTLLCIKWNLQLDSNKEIDTTTRHIHQTLS